MQLFDFEQTAAPTTYRKRALEAYGAMCALCGYGLYVEMLDVHHIDSNRKNGKLSNLEVRCMWCHGIETRKVRWHVWNGAEFSKHWNIQRNMNIPTEQFNSLRDDSLKLQQLLDAYGSSKFDELIEELVMAR